MGSTRGNASGTSTDDTKGTPSAAKSMAKCSPALLGGMILVVSTATGGASRQLANRQPEELARSLLRDFVLANREGMLAAPRIS
jgi:hypothetical protein